MLVEGSSTFLFGSQQVTVMPSPTVRREPDNELSESIGVTVKFGGSVLVIPTEDFELFVAALNTAHSKCVEYRESMPNDFARWFLLEHEDFSDQYGSLGDDDDDDDE